MHSLSNNPFLSLNFKDKILETLFNSMVSEVNKFEESEDGIATLHIDMPGVKANDLDITLDKNIITVKAERKDKYHNNYIETSFNIPYKYNLDTLQASLEDGVLILKIEKLSEKILETKKIKVNALKP